MQKLFTKINYAKNWFFFIKKLTRIRTETKLNFIKNWEIKKIHQETTDKIGKTKKTLKD